MPDCGVARLCKVARYNFLLPAARSSQMKVEMASDVGPKC